VPVFEGLRVYHVSLGALIISGIYVATLFRSRT
jgi:hypothetical protein